MSLKRKRAEEIVTEWSKSQPEDIFKYRKQFALWCIGQLFFQKAVFYRCRSENAFQLSKEYLVSLFKKILESQSFVDILASDEMAYMWLKHFREKEGQKLLANHHLSLEKGEIDERFAVKEEFKEYQQHNITEEELNQAKKRALKYCSEFRANLQY